MEPLVAGRSRFLPQVNIPPFKRGAWPRREIMNYNHRRFGDSDREIILVYSVGSKTIYPREFSAGNSPVAWLNIQSGLQSGQSGRPCVRLMIDLGLTACCNLPALVALHGVDSIHREVYSAISPDKKYFLGSASCWKNHPSDSLDSHLLKWQRCTDNSVDNENIFQVKSIVFIRVPLLLGIEQSV